MPQLIVRDTDGQPIVSRPLECDEHLIYYQAWMAKDLVTFGERRFKLHSVAKTRPEQNVVLCVSFDSWVMGTVDCE